MSTEQDTYELKTSRGRLAYVVSGPRDGKPIVLLHGTPGSKIGPNPRPFALFRLGVRLITYDRPGYGRSERQEGRTVADAAVDVEAIMDHLRIERFGVVGRSGGGPHALACAAQLRDRVTRVAVLVPLAPANSADLDWYAGMAHHNVRDYITADADQASLVAHLRSRAELARTDPESMVRYLEPELNDNDKHIVFNAQIRQLLTETYKDAFLEGADGWIDDVLAFRKDWKVELSRITAPVRLWHGAQDTFSPVAHTRWLERQLRRAGVTVDDVEVERDAAHFGAVETLPKTLAWLAQTGAGEGATARPTARGARRPAGPRQLTAPHLA